jgi:hypothetical protein
MTLRPKQTISVAIIQSIDIFQCIIFDLHEVKSRARQRYKRFAWWCCFYDCSCQHIMRTVGRNE